MGGGRGRHNTRNFHNKSPAHVSGSAGGGETSGSEGGWVNGEWGGWERVGWGWGEVGGEGEGGRCITTKFHSTSPAHLDASISESSRDGERPVGGGGGGEKWVELGGRGGREV